MVMNLTRSNYAGAPSAAYAGIEGQSANGLEALSAQSLGQNSSLPDTANMLVAETSRLIQSQQKLIEGQRKLIEEQSRLIQEKSMLMGVETAGNQAAGGAGRTAERSRRLTASHRDRAVEGPEHRA